MKFLMASLLFAAMVSGNAQTGVPDPKIPHADYANPALWLCRPDLKDNKCKVDLTATVIPGDGKISVEKFVPAKDPKIDCFFVYPTVSLDPGYQSDFVPAAHEEIDDIRDQFARFGAVCRQFAPMYRQTTLTALRASAGGRQPVGDRPVPGIGGYNDVLDAWNYYLSHDNKGRGVVLIGHSQGAAMVTRLLMNEIDGKPVQRQLVSALVIGGQVLVPDGADVGGTFKAIPLCRKDGQIGCVIAYSTYRDTHPPSPDALFGKSRDGLVVACTNPANLASGKGEPRSYFMTKGFLNDAGGPTQPDWLTPHQEITTPFVTTPGLVTTTCTHQGDFTYLSFHVNAVPSDPRTDTLAGEVIRATGPDLRWGLHILDIDHSMGSLVDIVKAQSKAYLAQRGKSN